MLLVFFLTIVSSIASPVEAREPTIQEIQAQTIRYSGYNQRELDGWNKKVRWAAALPRLQVGFDRDLKDVVSLSTRDTVSVTGGNVQVGPDENKFDKNFNQGTSIGVKALWYLDELVFNRDLLAVSGERREWVRERARGLEAVTEAFFVRKRLMKELETGRDPLPVREQKKLMIDQMNGKIDAQTGGWFSEELLK